MQILLMLGVSLIPFGLGWLVDWIVTYHTALPVAWPAGILYLCLWGLAAYLMKPCVKSTKKVVLWMHLVPLVVLILLGAKSLVGEAWPFWISAWTQHYYTLFLSIGYMLTEWSQHMFVTYCAEFILMVAASILGCVLQDKKK